MEKLLFVKNSRTRKLLVRVYHTFVSKMPSTTARRCDLAESHRAFFSLRNSPDNVSQIVNTRLLTGSISLFDRKMQPSSECFLVKKFSNPLWWPLRLLLVQLNGMKTRGFITRKTVSQFVKMENDFHGNSWEKARQHNNGITTWVLLSVHRTLRHANTWHVITDATWNSS